MSEDQRFEIERAFDLLPHVVGASWAVTWFRLNRAKSPTPEEFRGKVALYFDMLHHLFESYPQSGDFAEIAKYIRQRQQNERDKIIKGQNREVEKRYQRYLDYG